MLSGPAARRLGIACAGENPQTWARAHRIRPFSAKIVGCVFYAPHNLGAFADVSPVFPPSLWVFATRPASRGGLLYRSPPQPPTPRAVRVAPVLVFWSS